MGAPLLGTYAHPARHVVEGQSLMTRLTQGKLENLTYPHPLCTHTGYNFQS